MTRQNDKEFVILSVAKNPYFKSAIRTLNLRLNLNQPTPQTAESGYFATLSMTKFKIFSFIQKSV